jgi:hypothetical protein
MGFIPKTIRAIKLFTKFKQGVFMERHYVCGIRKQKVLLTHYNNTNRVKEFRGKRVARLTENLYAKREKSFQRKRFGLNELIVDNYFLRVKTSGHTPMCPMRIYK